MFMLPGRGSPTLEAAGVGKGQWARGSGKDQGQAAAALAPGCGGGWSLVKIPSHLRPEHRHPDSWPKNQKGAPKNKVSSL